MNWFDICILIVVLYSIIKGYKSGLVKQLASLAGVIAGAILSGQVAQLIAPYIEKVGNFSGSIVQPLCYILSFLLIILFFYVLGKMLHTIIQSIKLGSINKLAGLILCLAKWLIAVSILLNVVIKMDEQQQLFTEKIQQGSITYQYIQPIAPSLVPFLKFNQPYNQ